MNSRRWHSNCHRVVRKAISEDEFERRRQVFCVEAGRRGVELTMERTLPDSVDEFMRGGNYASSYMPRLMGYQDLWIEASDHVNQAIAKTARIGYERTQEEERRNAAATDGYGGADVEGGSAGQHSWRERLSSRVREFDGREAASRARARARSATQAARKYVPRFHR